MSLLNLQDVRARRCTNFHRSLGQATAEVLIATSMFALAITLGDPSPLKLVMDALRTSYHQFLIHMMVP